MLKRLICGLLCLLLLPGLAAPALAAEKAPETEEAPARVLHIDNLWEFQLFAINAVLDSYSQGLTVVLTADLDLTGEDFEGIPIFCGTFSGNGHTISGLELTADGSSLGLFRYLTESAVVSDLKVKGSIQPQGSRENIGGIAGCNKGLIQNCTFEGDIAGSSGIGGIAGENTLSGIIENCRSRGSIQGSHFVGGIAGKNAGVIRDSANTAGINTTALQNTVALEDITLDSMVSSESAATVTDIGGIAGSSTGVIRKCVNRGNVGYQHMGYNIGGIAGTQSGYIGSCENLGVILGRKEVGGIVGQLEPAALIQYEEDALQILQRQVNSLSATVSKTAANAQSAGDSLYGTVFELYGHVENAGAAIETLIPDPDDPQLPDEETLQAAKNNLSSSLSGMNSTLGGMSATVESSIGKLSNNLHTMQNQLNAMSATIGNASETLGGSITDVSDEDTQDDLTGKVESCRNLGKVLADMNAGGIAGAIAMENDLDPEEDLDILGDSSLNFESRLRAVLLNCENSGTVTAGKRCAGGIAGWQSLGLVKSCRNSGAVAAEGAEYVGGISGQSSGYIRHCYAKCALSGSHNVGGIAGSGAVVTDCRALVGLEGVSEAAGAILGGIEKNSIEEENPIAGNFYLPMDRDIGGIDGISYDGQAQSLSKQAFFRLEDLPEAFRTVTVTFLFDYGRNKVFPLDTGSALDPGLIPQPPEKEGQYARWEGLEEADLKNICLDLTFFPVYTSLPSVIESQAPAGEKKPRMLLQGTFAENTTLTLTESEYLLFTREDESILGAWDFTLSPGGTVTTGRLALPEGCDSEHIRLQLRKNGQWEDVSHTLDGSYAVFSLDSQAEAVALIQGAKPSYLPWILLGGAVTLGGLVLVLRRKKKK